MLVVMVRFLPLALTLAAPCRTCRPAGCASAAPALMKALARARARLRGRAQAGKAIGECANKVLMLIDIPNSSGHER